MTKNDYNLSIETVETENINRKRKWTDIKEDVEKNLVNGDIKGISSINNHIYFYSGVNQNSALHLNKEIKTVTDTLLMSSTKLSNKPPPIYLHINSPGGGVFACLSIIDTIKNNVIPIYSIIEGSAASAATLISVSCDKRYILPNSHMLIHQLSSGYWGKFNEMEDDMENCKNLMVLIKDIYLKTTKLKEDELDEILKHDLWWNAEKCKKTGLVDKILKPKLKVKVSMKKLV
jgi:ATP-dependent Clp endopeptidase proteolytic subunit ClpP